MLQVHIRVVTTANQGKTHVGNTTSLVTITSCTANAETVVKNTVGIE